MDARGHDSHKQTRNCPGGNVISSYSDLAFTCKGMNLRAYCDRKRAQGKLHNAALICLARRRTDVLYAMLRDRKPCQQTNNQDPQPNTRTA